MIKVFITDVDGTLYDHKRMEIPKANIDAIKLLQKKGVIIVIATARTYASSQIIVKELDMENKPGYLIASNGGSIYDTKDKSLIYEKPIPMSLLYELHKYGLNNDLHFNVEQDEYVVTNGYDPGIAIDNQIVGVNFMLTSPLNDYWAKITHEPYKVSFTQRKELIDEHYLKVDKLFGDRLYICHAGDNFIDIVLKDVNKSTAVAHLLDKLGYDFKDVAAIGDGDNDSWLLAKAGFSAAMANGTALAKSSAKVLVGSCADGGLSEFVELLLKSEE
ncbi:MAG: HAD family hydrolase [Erysipelotrichaceae bacterium]|nr:HAD family hydrolase [Erysipelotrichaceae bacterium]